MNVYQVKRIIEGGCDYEMKTKHTINTDVKSGIMFKLPHLEFTIWERGIGVEIHINQKGPEVAVHHLTDINILQLLPKVSCGPRGFQDDYKAQERIQPQGTREGSGAARTTFTEAEAVDAADRVREAFEPPESDEPKETR